VNFETRAVHAGVAKDSSFNSVITPLYPSSTFSFDRIGVNKGYDYTRSGNPTRAALEENLTALEGGYGCRATATGMAAIATSLHLLKPGDHVITGNDIYGGTYRLMQSVFAPLGIAFSFVQMTDPSAVEKAVRPATKMIWIETPSNPLLNLVDIRAVAAIGRRVGALVAVDNTFMSPLLQRPFQLGAHLVIHSTTKYINGHSDVVGGAVIAADKPLLDRVAFLVNAIGLSQSPWDSWLVLRGVKSLSQRMRAHCENALAVAEALAKHPAVKDVRYPGLKSHPQYALAKSQMSGAGGMVCFELNLDQVPIEGFLSRLKLFTLAESLGGVESLVEIPWYMSHASIDEAARREAGLTPGTVRLSIGIESAEDLVADITQALG
jgi:cystathionine beta-lyase/cystathionine gamma-synthase